MNGNLLLSNATRRLAVRANNQVRLNARFFSPSTIGKAATTSDVEANDGNRSESIISSFGYYIAALAEESPCHYYAALAECPRATSLTSAAVGSDTSSTLQDTMHHGAPEGQRRAYATEAVATAWNQEEEERLSKFYSTLLDVPSSRSDSTPEQRYLNKIQEILPSEAGGQALPNNILTATFDARPVVVTELNHPFRIVAVNDAWEGLCGYTADEAKGRTLAELLHGPETDTRDLGIMMEEVMTGYEGSAVVTNYTKDGRKFRNRLKVGCMVQDGKATNFVGVLKEIS